MAVKIANLVLKQVGTTLFLLLESRQNHFSLPTVTVTGGELFDVAKQLLEGQLGVGVKKQFGRANLLSCSGAQVFRPFASFFGIESDITSPIYFDVVTLVGDLPKGKDGFEWQMLAGVDAELQGSPERFHAIDRPAIQFLLNQYHDGLLEVDFH